MSSDDFTCLHDVYEGLEINDKCQKTSYVIQFLWRELTSDFDVIGPYFTCPSTIETRFLHSIVTRTVLAFSQFGFGVRALLCDGASTNLSLLKLLCGHCNELDDNIKPWFSSPFDGKEVFLIVCPSHQVCERNLLLMHSPHMRHTHTHIHTMHAHTYTHSHTHTHTHFVLQYS